jgi:ribosomal protein S27AE
LIKNEYKLTLNELKTLLFKRKLCPNCGTRELTRGTEKIYKGRQKSTSISMNLMHEDVYMTSIIYECKMCSRKYTLQGLNENKELYEQDQIVGYGQDDTINTKNNMEFRNGKIRMKKFLNLWCLVSILILLSISFQDHNFYVILIFLPIILIVFLIVRFFIK